MLSGNWFQVFWPILNDDKGTEVKYNNKSDAIIYSASVKLLTLPRFKTLLNAKPFCTHFIGVTAMQSALIWTKPYVELSNFQICV